MVAGVPLDLPHAYHFPLPLQALVVPQVHPTLTDERLQLFVFVVTRRVCHLIGARLTANPVHPAIEAGE